MSVICTRLIVLWVVRANEEKKFSKTHFFDNPENSSLRLRLVFCSTRGFWRSFNTRLSSLKTHVVKIFDKHTRRRFLWHEIYLAKSQTLANKMQRPSLLHYRAPDYKFSFETEHVGQQKKEGEIFNEQLRCSVNFWAFSGAADLNSNGCCSRSKITRTHYSWKIKVFFTENTSSK